MRKIIILMRKIETQTRPVTPELDAAGRSAPLSVEIVVTPSASLLTVVAVQDVFRSANRMHGTDLYRVRIATVSGGRVCCANGMWVEPDLSVAQIARPDVLVVVLSYEQPAPIRQPIIDAIRRSFRAGGRVCGCDLGVCLLIEAGITGDAPVSCHWEAAKSLEERYPDISFNSEPSSVHGRVHSCGGFLAGTPMAIEIVREQFGAQLSSAVETELLFSRAGIAQTSKDAPDPPSRAAHEDMLDRTRALMRVHIEDPLDIATIARRLGVSRRKLEYLCQRRLGMSPGQLFLKIRLERARDLLLYSRLPVVEIAIICGFTAPSAFSKSFGQAFGISPRNYRGRFRDTAQRPVLYR